jgi:trimeric autotransporter adhesin
MSMSGLLHGLAPGVVAMAAASTSSAATAPPLLDPLAQHAYLKASNTGPGDQFGYAVAMSGDTLVIGAYGEDSSAAGVDGDQADNAASSSGAAYVFVRNGSTWSQQAYLKASNAGANDLFGYSVGVADDTIVVGAFMEDSSAAGVNGDQANNGANGSGAAYVFVRDGTIWTQQAYLKASNTGMGDWFGWSVAISGDTVLVGALREDSGATGVNGDQSGSGAIDSGAVYVFVRNGSTWSQQAYLKPSNTDIHDEFGYSVAASGDTILIGASDEDSSATGVDGDQGNDGAPSAGAAFIFVRTGAAWTQQAYLKASNTGAEDFFGISVAISGDTALVGAFNEDGSATGVNGDQGSNGAVESGAAYVFVRNGAIWGAAGLSQSVEHRDGRPIRRVGRALWRHGRRRGSL